MMRARSMTETNKKGARCTLQDLSVNALGFVSVAHARV